MNKQTMNMQEITVMDSLPSRHSKHQGVFGKYAASEAALQGGWGSRDTIYSGGAFDIMTPMTPILDYPVPTQPGNDSLEPMVSGESSLMTPESLYSTVSPDALLSAENSPLFEDIDNDEMQNWESLFVEESGDSSKESSVSYESNGQPVSPAESFVNSTEGQSTKGDLFEVKQESPMDFLGNSPAEHLVNSTSNSPMVASQALSPMGSSSSRIETGGVFKAGSKNRPGASKKVDDLGITMYKRKPRAAPLKPVEIPDDGDNAAAKRAKNTEAARRSRARKLERMSQLEERVRELLDENQELRDEIARLNGVA